MTSIGMVTPEGPGRRRVARAGAAQLALPGFFLAITLILASSGVFLVRKVHCPSRFLFPRGASAGCRAFEASWCGEIAR